MTRSRRGQVSPLSLTDIPSGDKGTGHPLSIEGVPVPSLSPRGEPHGAMHAVPVGSRFAHQPSRYCPCSPQGGLEGLGTARPVLRHRDPPPPPKRTGYALTARDLELLGGPGEGGA